MSFNVISFMSLSDNADFSPIRIEKTPANRKHRTLLFSHWFSARQHGNNPSHMAAILSKAALTSIYNSFLFAHGM